MDFKEIKEILERDLSDLTPREKAYALAQKISIYHEFGLKRRKEESESDEHKAWRMTREAPFLTTREEKEMYAGARLAALRWGKKIDVINRASRKSVIELAGGEKQENTETEEERRERIKANFEKSVKLQKYFKEYK